MGLFSAGPAPRSSSEVREAQLNEEKADLRASGRSGVTVDDLKARAAAIRKLRTT